MRVFLAALFFAALAQVSAFHGPAPRAHTSSVSMSMDRRAAAAALFGGLAVATLGADQARADGLPDIVKCPAPGGICENWKKGKQPSPSFAEVSIRLAQTCAWILVVLGP